MGIVFKHTEGHVLILFGLTFQMIEIGSGNPHDDIGKNGRKILRSGFSGRSIFCCEQFHRSIFRIFFSKNMLQKRKKLFGHMMND